MTKENGDRVNYSSTNNTDYGSGGNGNPDDEPGPGKGFYHMLRRLWYHLIILFIGAKFSAIETFTKHRKLNFNDITHLPTREYAVITGGARGIGAEVVKQLLQLEMNVFIGCRNPTAGESLVRKLRDEGVNTGTVECYALDLNSLESVRQFAETILNRNVPIHLLINNAGVMFTPFKLTGDGFEAQFQTNYLSHFLLTMLLQPALNAAGKPNAPSKVINVSSAAQYAGDVNFNDLDGKYAHSTHLSYPSSKLMQVVSAIDLNRRFQESKSNIRVYALHPGVVRTDLYENVWWVNAFGRALNCLFKTPAQGADGIIFVAFSPTVNQDGGTFYANCKPYHVNPLALSRDVQEKLYKTSLDLCGLNHLKANNFP